MAEGVRRVQQCGRRQRARPPIREDQMGRHEPRRFRQRGGVEPIGGSGVRMEGPAAAKYARGHDALDASRAHFHSALARELTIQLLAEDSEAGKVGLLHTKLPACQWLSGHV